MDDTDILQLFFNRDQNAIKETETRYGKLLRRISENMLHNREDAEECVNDTLLAAWNSIPPHKPEYLSGYLARILRRISCGKLDSIKAYKRSAEIVALTSELEEVLASPWGVEKEYEQKEVMRALNNFLNLAEDEDRNLFVRRYFCSETVKEAAFALGISESAAKSRLLRIRQRLRDFFIKEGIIE